MDGSICKRIGHRTTSTAFSKHNPRTLYTFACLALWADTSAAGLESSDLQLKRSSCIIDLHQILPDLNTYKIIDISNAYTDFIGVIPGAIGIASGRHLLYRNSLKHEKLLIISAASHGYSHQLCNELQQAGFGHALVLRHGLKEWLANGQPFHKLSHYSPSYHWLTSRQFARAYSQNAVIPIVFDTAALERLESLGVSGENWADLQTMHKIKTSLGARAMKFPGETLVLIADTQLPALEAVTHTWKLPSVYLLQGGVKELAMFLQRKALINNGRNGIKQRFQCENI